MNEAEFEKLVAKIRPELVRIAARRGGRDQADDAVQKAAMQIWMAGKWRTQTVSTVAGWLRHRARYAGKDEMKSITRLRDAQRNLRVLSDKGHKHTSKSPNSDGEGY